MANGDLTKRDKVYKKVGKAAGKAAGKAITHKIASVISKAGVREAYDAIPFKNKDIDRISGGTGKVLAKRTTHVPSSSTGKVLAKRTTHVPAYKP